MPASPQPESLHINVSMNFPGFALAIADDIPLTGITALFGHSGSGKSTLLRIIAGLESRAQGEVRIGSETLQGHDRRSFVAPHRRGIGLVFQDARLFPHLDVAGNLAYADRRSSRRDPNHRLTHALVVEAFDLAPLLARRPDTLSGGERQRVALARALLTRPRLVLMDEPLASVDGRRKREILPYVQRLPGAFGIPVIYVTHAIDEVAALADRILLISEGRRIAAGPIAEMMARLDLFPLTGRFEASALLDCRVARHDTADRITDLVFEGGELSIPLTDLELGGALRVRIRARDVILATERSDALSANNVIKGVIRELREDDGGFVDVQLACGPSLLLARVTRRSVRRLALAPGLEVYAIVKSTTVERP